MAEARHQDLSDAERRDALEVVERASVHKAHLLEKGKRSVVPIRREQFGPASRRTTRRNAASAGPRVSETLLHTGLPERLQPYRSRAIRIPSRLFSATWGLG